MQLHVQGKGPVTLTDKDFVAQGGQGKIYAKSRWVYKIYTDPAKMIPAAKIQELAVLDSEHIVRPQDLVLDQANRAIGFTMKRVAGAVPLARLFTNDFRNRHGITPEITLKLVEAIVETIRFIHDKGCLIVDGNEMNYLVEEQDFTRPWLIDVDSYQTPGFPATAIMPTIRDWHARRFTPLSDWFSFAVVACQLFIGIHPYKGRYPGFKKHDLEGRMKANASIFGKRVGLPAAVRDFSHIPQSWLDWFIALFEQGRREPPPQTAARLHWRPQTRIIQSGGVAVTLLQHFSATILRVKTWNGIRVVTTTDALIIDGKPYQATLATEVIFAPRSLVPLLVHVEDGELVLQNTRSGRFLYPNLKAERLLVVDNTLYTLHHDKFMEVRLHELGDRFILSPGSVWKVLPQATVVLQSLLYQDVLGRAHLLIPLRPGACQVIPTPELDGYRIVDGRWDGGVAMLIGVKAGRYLRFIFRFNHEHSAYELRVEADLDTPDLNFVTLDNGVVVALSNALELFFREPARDALKRIPDPQLGDGERTLAKDGNSVLLFRDQQLYRISMQA